MVKMMTVFTLFFLSFSLFAQESNQKEKKKKDIVKTGWNLGALPVVAYNSDLGFEYGLLLNLVDFGDGSLYPNYRHKIYMEASQFTKGSGIYRVYYDSYDLIPGIRLLADMSFLPDKAYDFYGFNGYESVYNKDWETEDTPTYKTRVFYKNERNFLRLKADFLGKIKGNNLKWIAGIAARNFDVSSVDIDRLNKGKSDDEKLPSLTEQPGLYEKYIDWKIIPDNEKDGGYITTVKGGLVYDTRDVIANPGHGIWTEAVFAVSSKALGSESCFSKFSLIHRQYFSLISPVLSFAYRLGYQTTLSGHTPFYYQPYLESSEMTKAKMEGLGGDTSIRGVKRNRIVGDAIAFANFELRWKFWRFSVANQNIYLGLNAFVDCGQVTKKIDINDQYVDLEKEEYTSYFNSDAEKLHFSTGLGLKIAMNENFIISIDFGKALDEQDGDTGLYIGLNYLF